MKKVYGVNPVKELIKSGKPITRIEIYKNVNRQSNEELFALAKKRNIEIKFVDRKEDNSQGFVAIIENYSYLVDEAEFLEKLVRKKNSIVIILDRIQDPRNLGAIIRSAEAFGVDGIVLSDKKSVGITPSVIKTSTGAIEFVDIIVTRNLNNFVASLKKIDFWIYGAEAGTGNRYYDIDFSPKSCLVLGSEGAGIRKKLKNNCDVLMEIPLKGKINSLNVSVAGGVLLSEISKK